MAKILDKKDYKKLEDLSKYATGLYSTRLAECNRIYTAVSAIDFEAYVNRFNSIVINSHPTTTELNDMKDLLDDVTADLGFVKGYINPSDSQVSAPAFVVRGELSTLQSKCATAHKELTKRLKHPKTSKIKGVIEEGKKGMTRVVLAHKAFTDRAERIYNATMGIGEDGFDSFFGKGRK